MTQGDYVTLECSKRLKELGYDGKTSGKYVEKIPGTEREEWDEEEFMMVQITDVVTYPKVHLYDAQKWLREKHGIRVLPRTESCKADFRVNIYEGCHSFSPVGWFSSYEFALQAGIDEALNLLDYNKE